MDMKSVSENGQAQPQVRLCTRCGQEPASGRNSWCKPCIAWSARRTYSRKKEAKANFDRWSAYAEKLALDMEKALAPANGSEPQIEPQALYARAAALIGVLLNEIDPYVEKEGVK